MANNRLIICHFLRGYDGFLGFFGCVERIFGKLSTSNAAISDVGPAASIFIRVAVAFVGDEMAILRSGEHEGGTRGE